MDKLIPHLYELSQGSQVAAAQVLVDQITERQEEFHAICESKGGRGPVSYTHLTLPTIGGV